MQLTLIDKTQHYITKCFTRILDLIDCVCEKCVDFPKRKQTINYFLYQIEKNEKNGYEDDPVWWVTTHQPWIIFLSLQRQKKEVVKHNSIEFILLLGKSGLLSFSRRWKNSWENTWKWKDVICSRQVDRMIRSSS